MTTKLTMQSISFYLPMVFDKIEGNLEYYVKCLEEGQTEVD